MPSCPCCDRRLAAEAWRREFDAQTKEIESRANRYPHGFRVDDSRESIQWRRRS
jgi:hypothetical protein